MEIFDGIVYCTGCLQREYGLDLSLIELCEASACKSRLTRLVDNILSSISQTQQTGECVQTFQWHLEWSNFCYCIFIYSTKWDISCQELPSSVNF